MTKSIPLSQGKCAIVDDEDYEYLNQWKWHILKSRNLNYAARNIGKYPNRSRVLMHREILNSPDDTQVDHKNRDGLINTRDNLRICNYSQNAKNRKIRIDSKTGYKGVTRKKDRFIAYIVYNTKQIYLGSYISAEDAAREYDKAAIRYHGEFARINFG